MRRLVLVDLAGVALRYHFSPGAAVDDAIAAKGTLRVIERCCEGERADVIGVMEGRGERWRAALLTDYKAARNPLAVDAREAIVRAADAVQRLENARLAYGADGHEADDEIARLVREHLPQRDDIVIASDDKDFAQLVGYGVRQFLPRKWQIIDEADVRETWRLEPHQIPGFLALAGDASDGVPGLPGIGPAAARWILQRWGSFEEALKRAESGDVVMSRRVDRILRENADAARLYYRVVNLRGEP